MLQAGPPDTEPERRRGGMLLRAARAGQPVSAYRRQKRLKSSVSSTEAMIMVVIGM